MTLRVLYRPLIDVLSDYEHRLDTLEEEVQELEEEVDEGGGGGEGGGGDSIMKHVKVTLTNDQVKALPSGEVEIVPAPGAGKILIPQFAVFRSPWVADYTNIANHCVMLLTQPSSGGMLTIFAEVSEGAKVSYVLAGGYTTINFLNWPINSEGFTDIAQPIPYGWGYFDDGMINGAITLRTNNVDELGAPAGNFTGGNAGNGLVIDVYYFEYSI